MPDAGNTGVAALLQAHLAAGMVVLDIGANDGALSAVAADRAGPSGRVVAYEPFPDTAETLVRRFAGLPQVTVRAVAVSDVSGPVTLHLDAGSSKRHSLYASIVSRPGPAVHVTAVTLDEEMACLPRVDLIKIDAQGAEGRILRGGRTLLARDRPALVFELWPAGLAAAGTPPEALLAALEALGYRCMQLSVKGVRKSPPAVARFLAGAAGSRWASTNIVALPRPASRGRLGQFVARVRALGGR